MTPTPRVRARQTVAHITDDALADLPPGLVIRTFTGRHGAPAAVVRWGPRVSTHPTTELKPNAEEASAADLSNRAAELLTHRARARTELVAARYSASSPAAIETACEALTRQVWDLINRVAAPALADDPATRSTWATYTAARAMAAYGHHATADGRAPSLAERFTCGNAATSAVARLLRIPGVWQSKPDPEQVQEAAREVVRCLCHHFHGTATPAQLADSAHTLSMGGTLNGSPRYERAAWTLAAVLDHATVNGARRHEILRNGCTWFLDDLSETAPDHAEALADDIAVFLNRPF
ncbi:hypothetical protein [Streptomyces armeniacus]|uniref:hypothetical protein n=1 Tax=Streptomyces armeniacus TaxID=83291 RepID=UPI001AD7ED84|nr:hypothetical protein [Streptomyces armeniacus]